MKYNIVKRMLPLAFFAAFSTMASAQNLDPTVEVSRVYEGKLIEVHKPQIEMAVPDSVLRFDLEFDYSVSESPYKGAYEFSPYAMHMKPSETVRDVNSLYVRAGAGYQLHPEADVIWNLKPMDALRMNVYGSHRSFIGNYWSFVEPSSENAGEIVLDRLKKKDGSSRAWKGYDLVTQAGVDGRYDWDKGLLRFDVGYKGIAQQSSRYHEYTRGYNALDASFGVASKRLSDSHFHYDVIASYGLASDHMTYTSALGSTALIEHQVKVDGRFAYSLDNGDDLRFDLGFDWISSAGSIEVGAGNFQIAPHYVMDRGRWNVDLGVKIAKVFRAHTMVSDMFPHEEQVIYPDARISFMALPDAMKIYLAVGGGNKMNSYSSLVRSDRRIDAGYGRGVWNIMDVTDESVSAVLGVKGRVSSILSYELRGGYVNYANALLDAVTVCKVDDLSGFSYLPAVGYTPYEQAFAQIDLLLETERVSAGGNMKYAHTWGLPVDGSKGFFLPANLNGEMYVGYNWSKRVYAGLDCVFSTARKGTVLDGTSSLPAKIPGYADLGVDLEYVFSPKLSFWARGGNLLNMTVQKSLLYAEKGAYFTLGVCLNL